MIKMSENINELASALSKAQAEFEGASKNSKGYNFTYADLFEITEMIKPIIAKHGLSYMQMPVLEGDKAGVTTLVMHTSGQFVQSTLYGPIPKMNTATEIQALGSAITYLRRYALSSAFGIAQADDSIIEQHKQEQPRQAPQKQQRPQQQRPQAQQQRQPQPPQQQLPQDAMAYIADMSRATTLKEVKEIFAVGWKTLRDEEEKQKLLQAYEKRKQVVQ